MTQPIPLQSYFKRPNSTACYRHAGGLILSTSSSRRASALLDKSLLRPRVPASGQTSGGSAEGRKSIESYAMDLAFRHYATLWQDVLDVSATEPFDLLCREGDRELRVEVKGTTSLGLSVLLTRNEGRHAQENNGRAALFVVSDIVANLSGATCRTRW